MILNFRKTSKHDFPEIDRINGGEFYFKRGELSIVDGVISDVNGKTIAFGIVKPRAEAIFIADKNLPTITRAKALKELMRVAIWGTKKANINQLHVFVSSPELAKSLIKHYGFSKVEEIVLVKNLNHKGHKI